MNPATVAVRALCEFAARSGDLDLRFTPAPSALEGMAGHARVRSRRAPGYETEVTLSGLYQDALQVRGRADGFDPEAGQLEEIKTYRGQLDGVRDHHRALHQAQARTYGHLLCQARGLTRLRVALVYVNVDTDAKTVLTEDCTAAELQAHFDQLCQRYLSWARAEAAHRLGRDAAMAGLAFPHGDFRSGQRELSVAVYRAARQGAQTGNGACLMAQAPTGIGKTLGTVFPMLKAMAHQGLDKLFFLTAKGTGQGVALRALAQLQPPPWTNEPAPSPACATVSSDAASATPSDAAPDAAPDAAACPADDPPLAPAAPRLRVLALLARDKACEHPDKACHGESCPLARGFFDRLPAARAAAPALADWHPASVRTLALAHGICPYYLAQELVRWSDVVVGDYNHYYDSSALLHALTREQGWRVGVLVDEAHNLVDRARRMYSAELSPFTLAAARQQATGPVRTALDRLRRCCTALASTQTADYAVLDAVPPTLLTALQRVTQAVGQAQDAGLQALGEDLLALHFEALQLLQLAEQFGPHALFDIARLPARATDRPHARASAVLGIRNVIPAPHLAPRHASAQATVLFSGTLNPPAFYRDLLGLPPTTAQVDIDTPFAADQLQVHVVREVSTRWADRAQSLTPIADLVAQQHARAPGNYLCFFSSFDYLQRVAERLRERHPALPLCLQTPAMDAAGREAFLAGFTETSRVVGLVVLGGVFAEGVDLPGRRLIGAFVATLGLPQLGPVNDAMRRVLAQRFGARQGDDYTYLYPGLRKVVQAAGRVIRSEDDRGTIHLIDDRYGRPHVQALLPRWWRLQAASAATAPVSGSAPAPSPSASHAEAARHA
ncbi:ATP-dependent DNA helicase [Comamonas serinivorans]|uniref:ATP-dependent DNA helicase n=1 Tax=Comamonas serinivorans TaxID=1082851 RepID=A0A1Y0EQP9_9BURK|nr:ATP-dependent DNA helicase [Comamonas serinivorans]ARU05977.1 ATP-dependent DNA helicase [Comamonas serinivorans]